MTADGTLAMAVGVVGGGDSTSGVHVLSLSAVPAIGVAVAAAAAVGVAAGVGLGKPKPSNSFAMLFFISVKLPSSPDCAS